MSYDKKTTRYEAIEPVESAEQVQSVSEGVDAVGFQPPEHEYVQEKRRDMLLHRIAERLARMLRFNNKEKLKKPEAPAARMGKVAGLAVSALTQNPADRDSKQQTAMARRPEYVEVGHGSLKASHSASGPQAKLTADRTLKHELKHEEKHHSLEHHFEHNKPAHNSPIGRAEHKLAHKAEHEIGKRLIDVAAHLVSPQIGLIVDAVEASHPTATPTKTTNHGHNDSDGSHGSHGGR